MIATRKNRKGRSKLNTFSVAVVVFVFYSALQISGGSCKPIESNDPINPKLRLNETSGRMSQEEIPKAKISVRVLRSAGSPEAQQEVPRRLFPPATTLMKKYAHTARLSKFHGGGGGVSNPAATRIITSGYNSPAAKLLVSRDNAMMPLLSGQEVNEDGQGIGDGGAGLLEQDPTFTPYISARALSNIPNFFDEIRANLHALQMDEGDHSFDEEMDSEDGLDEDEGSKVDTLGSPLRDILDAERYPEQKGLRWLPASFGARSRGSNIRHFVQHPHNMHNFIPARNAYEFGLG